MCIIVIVICNILNSSSFVLKSCKLQKLFTLYPKWVKTKPKWCLDLTLKLSE